MPLGRHRVFAAEASWKRRVGAAERQIAVPFTPRRCSLSSPRRLRKIVVLSVRAFWRPLKQQA